MVIPKNLKPATEYDFLHADGKLEVGMKFWVHTYYSDELEEHITFKGMKLERWKEWMEDRRIYVVNSFYELTQKTKDLASQIDYI
jgi:hypothetical protein